MYHNNLVLKFHKFVMLIFDVMNGHIPTSHFEFPKFAMLIFHVMDGFTIELFFLVVNFCHFSKKKNCYKFSILKKSPKFVT